MDPEDIESRDFFVGLRGYDRGEVQEFLAEVAAEHRAVLAELDELRKRYAEHLQREAALEVAPPVELVTLDDGPVTTEIQPTAG
jgi:DivIVA domain-containing protein